MPIRGWWKFNKVASGLYLLLTSLAFKTSAGCAFTCLFPFTFQVCPLRVLLSCLMAGFISSIHCAHSNSCLCLNHQTTAPTICLFCCAVLGLCLPLSLLQGLKSSSKKLPEGLSFPWRICLCLSYALALSCFALQVVYLDTCSIDSQALRTVFLPLHPRV